MAPVVMVADLDLAPELPMLTTSPPQLKRRGMPQPCERSPRVAVTSRRHRAGAAGSGEAEGHSPTVISKKSP